MVGPDDVAVGRVAARVGLVGVTHFVGKDIDVAAGAIEIGEDEGEVELVEVVAESSPGFALSGFEVDEAAFDHRREEGIEPVTYLAEHRMGAFNEGIVVADGSGVSLWEEYCFVPIFEGIDPKIGCLGLCEFACEWDDVFGDFLAENVDLLGAKSDPGAGVVGEGDVSRVAKFFRHRLVELYLLIVDAIQLLTIAGKPLRLGETRSIAVVAVWDFLVFSDLG